MTEETYNHICQLHHMLMDENSSLSNNFKSHCEKYWKLQRELTDKQWQTVNDCFCSFHKFYMAVLACALEDTP